MKAVRRLLPFLGSKKLTILCADTHLYQHDLIKIDGVSINQYIAGTGGAFLDKQNQIGSYDIEIGNDSRNYLLCKTPLYKVPEMQQLGSNFL